MCIRDSKRTATDSLRDLFRIALAVVAFYLLLSAYFGFRVGRAIYEAKSTNPFASIGANIVGQEYTERFAIEQMRIPAMFTASPAFWVALRASE
mgnify:CR=1 FL=1